jgi:hypothetical protein
MSQDAPDLFRFAQIIERYKALVGLTALLGALAGIVFATLHPAGSTSKALVVYAAPSCPAAGAICGGPMFSPTYAQAGVLKELPSGVQIKVVSGNILSISATAGTAAQAEALADSAADSYIAYVGSLSYLGEQPSAQILEPAMVATGAATPKQLLRDGLLGAIFGALVGVLAALAGSRTIIDPPTAPPGTDFREEADGAGQEIRPASSGVPLWELAREQARRDATRDSLLGGSEAEFS